MYWIYAWILRLLFFLGTHVGFSSCSCADSYKWVLWFLAHNRLFFGEYTYIFVVHMVYDILVVDMVVYDTQVWCGYVLFKFRLKFMTSRIVFAIVCMNAMVWMDMDYFYYLIGI